MKHIDGGVCAPQGFKAGGIWCGIRKNRDKRDLALIVSDSTCNAVALYTTNKVKAASIIVTQDHLRDGKCHGVICNSGNANACTGEAGLRAAKMMAQSVAPYLGLKDRDLAVASTGVIGVPLPAEKIQEAAEALVASLTPDPAGHEAALEAIMTTDTRKKDMALEFSLGNKTVRMGSMVKGSGMIHPNLATMLCFITTDVAISPNLLEAALRTAVRTSFNRITVDGDTSTNDMVLLLANGKAENVPIQEAGPEYDTFTKALSELCIKLAKDMARDGEGATHLVSCTVSGAQNEEAAEFLAKAVIGSSLVKAACFGADANWGRILCAMGYSGVDFDPASVKVSFKSSAGEATVCTRGVAVPFSEELAKKILSQDEIAILVDLENPSRSGDSGTATCWGCDLSYDYVRINGDYRS